MRAVSYERVSSDMQLEGFSLDAQHEANLRFIKGKGWRFARAYRDEGVSAKTTNRPAFQRMLRDAEAGLFDVIVIHKLDRFSRSVTDLLLTMRELDQRGVSVTSATEDFDDSTPIGRLFRTMSGGLAQWYLENLSAETKKGHHAQRRAGLWNATLPYGYYSEDRTVSHIDEDEAAVVRLAFEMYATGNHSATEIAEELNRRRIAPPGVGKRKDARLTWSKDTVANMLRNEFYAGWVYYKEERYEGAHEPIISEELFAQVVAARRERASNRTGGAKARFRVYLCSRRAYCAGCGESMRGTSSGVLKGGARYRYFTCDPRERQTGCTASRTRADVADDELGDYLCSLRVPAGWPARMMAQMKDNASEPEAGQDALRLKRKYERQLERAKELFLLGDIDKGEYLTMRDQLQVEITRLEAEMAPHRPADMEKAVRLLESFPDVWEVATPKERRAMARYRLEDLP